MSILITNIKEIILIEQKPVLRKSGAEMATLKTIKNGWLFIEDDRITDFGRHSPSPSLLKRAQESGSVLDATGRMVFPSFCDSHTHLVYAGSREIEYIDKIKGLTYEEIAKKGGGILNSAKRLHEASEEELIDEALG